jgi:hypothetical protein
MGKPAAIAALFILCVASSAQEKFPDHPVNTWIKRTPVEGSPPSPRLGYEGDCVWDAKHGVILRYGGHNQGGGGEQHSEVWTCDPFTGKWTLKEPNAAPPGVCCAQQNVYDPIAWRYIRFPSFSGSHGWQWSREIYMNQTSVWTYDLETNLWRNRRPFPSPKLAPLRCASRDAHHQVAVVFGGEGSSEGTIVYDPYLNTWKSMKPARQPEFRSGGNMTYDIVHRLHILFGSQFGNDVHTWAYDLDKNEWRDLKPETQPPTDKNDAVLAYDEASEKVIAIIKISEGKDEEAKHTLQTWSFDVEKNAWKRMNPAREPDASGNRARVLMSVPDLNLIFLEDCPSKPREQQVWSYRCGDVPRGIHGVTAPVRTSPRTPEDVIVSVIGAKEVEIAWKAPPKGKDIGADLLKTLKYVVERAPVDVLTEDQLKRLKSRTPPLEPPSVGAFSAVGEFKRITEKPVEGLSFVDRGVNLEEKPADAANPVWHRDFSKEERDDSGKPYRFAVFAYRVRAVADTSEGGPSEAVFTIPSMPQWVFSKEDGGACHVKWAASPEKGIKGYRVYRMDGRFDKEPITRLTTEPIAETTFTDPKAGKNARRYYVVAVDALGQEGLPSMPVWFEREWKKFYLPFTGEWHQ